MGGTSKTKQSTAEWKTKKETCFFEVRKKVRHYLVYSRSIGLVMVLGNILLHFSQQVIYDVLNKTYCIH